MNEQIYFSIIEEELAKLKVLINTDNDLNLKDKNIFLEDEIAYLLNYIYDINLVNTNFEISNYPAIDLKDEVNRVAVQVTTNTALNKIQTTLDNFFDNGFEKKFDKLLIVVFDEKKYRGSVNLKKKFDFNDKKHVITYTKLIKIIKNLPLSKLEAIYNYIDLSLRKHIYNVDWVINNTKRALNNLDKRYNRKLNVYTMNFDHFKKNVQVEDLYYFLRKAMEKQGFKEWISDGILNAYSAIIPLGKNELEYLKNRLMYPEKFFKVANSYYHSNKAWISIKNVEKMQMAVRQMNEKEHFLNHFFDARI